VSGWALHMIRLCSSSSSSGSSRVGVVMWTEDHHIAGNPAEAAHSDTHPAAVAPAAAAAAVVAVLAGAR
jgi:hypothetical protein